MRGKLNELREKTVTGAINLALTLGLAVEEEVRACVGGCGKPVFRDRSGVHHCKDCRKSITDVYVHESKRYTACG